MSADETLSPAMSAFIAGLPSQIQKFLESHEFLGVRARLTAIGSRYAGASSGDTLKMTFGGVSNLLVSSARHAIFLALWSEFDLGLEILIMRMANLDPKNVCTSLQAGVKMQIAQSLLNEKNDADGILMLESIQEIAARNAHAHGF
jgi:hypothetical protein